MFLSEGLKQFGIDNKPASFPVDRTQFIEAIAHIGSRLYNPGEVLPDGVKAKRDGDEVVVVKLGHEEPSLLDKLFHRTPRLNGQWSTVTFPSDQPEILCSLTYQDETGVAYTQKLDWKGQNSNGELDAEAAITEKMLGSYFDTQIVVDYPESVISLPTPNWVNAEAEGGEPWVEPLISFLSEAPELITPYLESLLEFLTELPGDGEVHLPIPSWIRSRSVGWTGEMEVESRLTSLSIAASEAPSLISTFFAECQRILPKE